MAPCHVRGAVADRTSYLTEKADGGRGRTRTCDLLRVKDVKIGKYLSFQGAFAALGA